MTPDPTCFGDVCDQEFQPGINLWIEHCTLYSNWTSTAHIGNKTCPFYQYGVTLEENDTLVAHTYTNNLKYSYWGLKVSTKYNVKVTPYFRCTNGKDIESSKNKRINSVEISSLDILTGGSPAKACLHNDDYQSSSVERWQRKMGSKHAVIEIFPTTRDVVTKTHGSQINKSTIVKENGNSVDIFLHKNNLLVFGVGSGGLLFILFLNILAIVCCVKRKREKRNDLIFNVEQEKLEANSIELVDSLYARPFSYNLYDRPDNTDDRKEMDQEKRIEIERKQIASLYSFGGFSMGEFQDEEVAYGNDRGTKYGNIM
ncbi:uncharacterized protein LOC134274855 isoform X2 [Saccostrea cucullata]|uniref:uncharacterized protein LOC134274855 isoform X2 n=1 Tax=Saccostrea cuccullata TaxID=36930 RepID=UPI002ED63492